MANPGEQTFKLHKMDDRTALDLMNEVKEFLGLRDEIQFRIVHGYDYNYSQLPADSFKAGQYRFSRMALHGVISEVGSSVRGGFEFSRFANGQNDVIDKNYDYFTFRLNNESGAWSSHIEKLLGAISIVATKDLPVIAATDDVTETYRAQLLSQDASHRRMLEDLNQSIKEMAARRAEIEKKAAEEERQRKEAHEAAQRELEEQKAALERQSYMATRRKIGQSIHKIMTDPDRQTSKNQVRRSTFALLVFVAYMGLGVSGFMGTWLTYQSFQELQVNVTNEYRMVESTAEKPAGSTGDESVYVLDSGGVGTATTLRSSEMDAIRWFLVIKFVLSSVLTVFGFVSAAVWMRRHLDGETRLAEEKIAFIADVERASWVIEAIHEVKAEAQSELPKEWVDAVTRNLFSPRQSASDLNDGAQAVRALLGLAAGAKVGPQGLEMEFNKKGTKSLSDTGA